MSDRPQEFVDVWVPAHINASTPQGFDLKPLAAELVAQAQQQGISKAELEDSLGDLEMFLSACIESAKNNA